MTVAPADLKAGRAVERGGGIEINHRVNDVIDAARHIDRYFIAENEVGTRNELLMLARIGPSFSLSARAVVHA